MARRKRQAAPPSLPLDGEEPVQASSRPPADAPVVRLCRCGKQRAPGKIFCDGCFAGYSKLWAPPDGSSTHGIT